MPTGVSNPNPHGHGLKVTFFWNSFNEGTDVKKIVDAYSTYNVVYLNIFKKLIFVHLVFRFLSLLPINCIPLVCAMLSLLNKCPRARVY